MSKMNSREFMNLAQKSFVETTRPSDFRAFVQGTEHGVRSTYVRAGSVWYCAIFYIFLNRPYMCCPFHRYEEIPAHFLFDGHHLMGIMQLILFISSLSTYTGFVLSIAHPVEFIDDLAVNVVKKSDENALHQAWSIDSDPTSEKLLAFENECPTIEEKQNGKRPVRRGPRMCKPRATSDQDHDSDFVPVPGTTVKDRFLQFPLDKNPEICPEDLFGQHGQIVVCDSGLESDRIRNPPLPTYNLINCSPCRFPINRYTSLHVSRKQQMKSWLTLIITRSQYPLRLRESATCLVLLESSI